MLGLRLIRSNVAARQCMAFHPDVRAAMKRRDEMAGAIVELALHQEASGTDGRRPSALAASKIWLAATSSVTESRPYKSTSRQIGECFTHRVNVRSLYADKPSLLSGGAAASPKSCATLSATDWNSSSCARRLRSSFSGGPARRRHSAPAARFSLGSGGSSVSRRPSRR